MNSDTFFLVDVQGFSYDDISINRIDVDRKSDALMSPVEEGFYIFDGKVIRPLTVTVSITVKEDKWEKVYSNLLKMYENRRYEFYKVVTKGEVIKNLMLTDIPRNEVPEKFDAIDAQLKFVQVIFANKKYGEITHSRAKSDSSTRRTGQKNASNAEKIVDLMFGNRFRMTFLRRQ